MAEASKFQIGPSTSSAESNIGSLSYLSSEDCVFEAGPFERIVLKNLHGVYEFLKIRTYLMLKRHSHQIIQLKIEIRKIKTHLSHFAKDMPS